MVPLLSAIGGSDSGSSSYGQSYSSHGYSNGLDTAIVGAIAGGDDHSQSYAAPVQSYSQSYSHGYSAPSPAIQVQTYEAEGVHPPQIQVQYQPASSGGFVPSSHAFGDSSGTSYASGHGSYNTVSSQSLATASGHDSYHGVDSYRAPPSGNNHFLTSKLITHTSNGQHCIHLITFNIILFCRFDWWR